MTPLQNRQFNRIRIFLRRNLAGKASTSVRAKKTEKAEPIRTWLQKNYYPFEDIYDAAHLMSDLYKYDLIIIAFEQKMPFEKGK